MLRVPWETPRKQVNHFVGQWLQSHSPRGYGSQSPVVKCRSFMVSWTFPPSEHTPRVLKNQTKQSPKPGTHCGGTHVSGVIRKPEYIDPDRDTSIRRWLRTTSVFLMPFYSLSLIAQRCPLPSLISVWWVSTWLTSYFLLLLLFAVLGRLLPEASMPRRRPSLAVLSNSS